MYAYKTATPLKLHNADACFLGEVHIRADYILRKRFGNQENEFEQGTGRCFNDLAESEARYLAKFKQADAVRARITEAALEGSRLQTGITPGPAAMRISAPDTPPPAIGAWPYLCSKLINPPAGLKASLPPQPSPASW
jgi:hypothetical protein